MTCENPQKPGLFSNTRMERSDEMIRMMPTRHTRRRIVYGTLFFCGFVILYCLFKGDPESTIHVNAMESAFYLMGVVVIGYAVSAVADNTVVYSRRKPVMMPGRSNRNYESIDGQDEDGWDDEDDGSKAG